MYILDVSYDSGNIRVPVGSSNEVARVLLELTREGVTCLNWRIENASNDG